jgi:GT2 family glycosyltransferase
MENSSMVKKNITVSIVHYNTFEYLIQCLKSIKRHSSSLTTEVLLVDNASNDFTPSLLYDIDPNLVITRNRQNMGFAYAHNQNFRLSKGDFFFVLNPDTSLTEGCLEGLLDVFSKYPDAGIVTPTLLFQNNKNATTHKDLPSVKAALLELLYINRLRNIMGKGHPSPILDNDKNIVDIPCINGAAFMVRRDVYAILHGLDERFFLYFEETDFCKRLNDLLRLRVYLIRDVFIYHYYGRSSITTDVRQTVYYESYYHYFKKHFSAFETGVIRLSILLGGILRFISLNIMYFPIAKGWTVYFAKILSSLRLIFWALGISPSSWRNHKP